MATALMAAASIVVLVAAAALTSWYRETWVRENPLQALAGAALAALGTAGSLISAVRTWQGRLAPPLAIGSTVTSLAAVAVGCLLFIRSGATVVPVHIEF